MNDSTTPDDALMLRRLAALEPPPEVMERAIERTRGALVARVVPCNKPAQQPERRGTPRWMRWSAIISILAGMVLVGLYYGFFAKSGTSNVLAEVQHAFQQVYCVTFTAKTIQLPENHPGMNFQTDGTVVQEFAGRRYRFESADGESISVYDLDRGVFMDIRPTKKQASIWHQDTTARGYPTLAELLERLRSGKIDKAERLVDGEIDGRSVLRYRIPPESRLSGGTEVLLSVDSATFLPVRIEHKTDAFGFSPPLHIVYKDFSFEPRDPSLFAMVPPEGYEVHVISEDDETVSEIKPLSEVPIDLGRPTVAFEFRWAEMEPAEGLIEATIPGWTPQTLYLHPQAIVENQHIQNIEHWEMPYSNHRIVIEFTEEGRARMMEATSKDLPGRLALLVDGQVVNAPLALSTISDKGELSGLSSETLRRLSESADP